MISIFQFRYDVKYKSIPSKFERLYNIYMCLFQCLVTYKDHCIILQAILSVALKANRSNIAQALKNICIFLERSVPSESHFNILQNSTLKRTGSIWKHVPLFILVPSRHMRGEGKGNRFF